MDNGDRSRLVLGAGARATLLERAGTYDVAAVLAHGDYDPGRRRPAGIRLADGLLECDDLEGAFLPPVVCLLACGAARGPQVIGDAGTIHLGGAALVGGAEAVLVAETDIETEATLVLFETFLRRLRRGDPPDEALRRARNAVRALGPRWSDPFFVSGIRLFGYGGPGPDRRK